jgi:hypothetical protein
MERTLWTPDLYGMGSGGCDFSVYLDRDFAREMMNSPLLEQNQKNMNRLGNDILKRLNLNWSNPYNFHLNSCLVDQIYVGNNGVWLATTCDILSGLCKDAKSTEPIKYNSHNTDDTHFAYSLMKLFGAWVEFSDLLRKNKP